MMPYLIIFLVFQRDFIDEREFVWNGGGESKESGGAVEPDGVVGRVKGYDVFGEFEDAG